MSEEEKIRACSVAIITVGAIAWAYWFIVLFYRMALRSWTNEILTWRIVENHMEITTTVRVIYFSMGLAIIALGSIAFYVAGRVLIEVYKGNYFQKSTCRIIKLFGAALVVSMIGDTLFSAFDHVVLTWNNTNETMQVEKGLSIGRPFIRPRFEYDPGDVSLALCGLGFFLIGWIFEKALKIQEENKAFV